MQKVILSLALGSLISFSAFAQQDVGQFSSLQIIQAAKKAIVDNYAANRRTIPYRDIVSSPDYFNVANDGSGRVDLGFYTHYVREAEFGVPDYCNVDLIVLNNSIKVDYVDCSPVD